MHLSIGNGPVPTLRKTACGRTVPRTQCVDTGADTDCQNCLAAAGAVSPEAETEAGEEPEAAAEEAEEEGGSVEEAAVLARVRERLGPAGGGEAEDPAPTEEKGLASGEGGDTQSETPDSILQTLLDAMDDIPLDLDQVEALGEIAPPRFQRIIQAALLVQRMKPTRESRLALGLVLEVYQIAKFMTDLIREDILALKEKIRSEDRESTATFMAELIRDDVIAAIRSKEGFVLGGDPLEMDPDITASVETEPVDLVAQALLDCQAEADEEEAEEEALRIYENKIGIRPPVEVEAVEVKPPVEVETPPEGAP